MIEQASGDLLASESQALVNTVNCVGVMGKGIALQFKRRYPSMYSDYRTKCNAGEVQIGRVTAYPTGEIGCPEWVINFPTKKHWRSPSKLEWIDAGLTDLVRVVRDLGIRSIAIPPLGAGNGGLDWSDVEPRIRAAFSELDHIEVKVFSPTSAPRSVVADKRRIRMTPGRALMVALMDGYDAARQSVDIALTAGVSHLELQKLMYFAHVVEPLPQISFTQGKYGPYSDVVRLMIQQMEGQFVSGFGDGADRVLQLRPIEITEAGRAAVTQYLDSGEKSPTVARVVDRVLSIVDGFEGAYGVELLATTHWVVTAEGANSVDGATAAVRRWSERKGRIFTRDHVSAGLDQLTRADLIEI